MSVWAEVRSNRNDGETLAALATTVKPVSGEVFNAGRLVTADGSYNLDVSFDEKEFTRKPLHEPDRHYCWSRSRATAIGWAATPKPSNPMGGQGADSQCHARLAAGLRRRELASGRLALPAEHRPGVIRFDVPRVRVQTAMQWIYRVQQAGKPAAIARGTAAVEVYPDNLLAGLAQRMAAKRLLVWDAADGLPALLKQSAVKHAVIGGEAELQFVRPDVVLVGADASGQGDDRAGEAAEPGPLGRQRAGLSPDRACFAGRLSPVAADRAGPMVLAGGPPLDPPSAAVDDGRCGARGLGGRVAGR